MIPKKKSCSGYFPSESDSVTIEAINSRDPLEHGPHHVLRDRKGRKLVVELYIECNV